jgi:membrane-bound serine protease (ClpP class)
VSFFLSLLFASFVQAAGPIHFLELHGSINPGSSAYIVESLASAQQQKAQALILRLDTLGGLPTSTREIIQSFSTSQIPVVVFIAPGGASATSAGALIAISAHVAAMAPGTNIGAAHPVGGKGEDIGGDMGRKVLNDTAALARAQATLRGRRPEAAETFVTKSASFSPEEALKAGVVDFMANDTDDLLRQLNGRKVKLQNPDREIILSTANLGPMGLVRREMNMKQSLLHTIADPTISALLMTVGGIAIYAEVSAGFTLVAPAVVGVFCFLLAFVSMQMLPINTGGAMLFSFGFVLLIAEIFVTSYGLLTLAAVASLFLGGLFLIDPSSSAQRVPLSVLISIVAGVAAIMGMITYLVLRDRRLQGAPIDRMRDAEAEVVNISGSFGTAYVNGELWQFETTDTLSPGDKAKVTAVNGLKVTIQRRS